MANKLGDLDARLGDVLLALPPLAIFYDGRDEVIAALNGIRTDTGSIMDVAVSMGVEPTPFSEAALAVQTNAETLINRVESTCHPMPDIYWCLQ